MINSYGKILLIIIVLQYFNNINETIDIWCTRMDRTAVY